MAEQKVAPNTETQPADIGKEDISNGPTNRVRERAQRERQRKALASAPAEDKEGPSPAAGRTGALDALRKKYVDENGKLTPQASSAIDNEARKIYGNAVVDGHAELIDALRKQRNSADKSTAEVEGVIAKHAAHFKAVTEYIDHKYGRSNLHRELLTKAGLTEAQVNNIVANAQKETAIDDVLGPSTAQKPAPTGPANPAVQQPAPAPQPEQSQVPQLSPNATLSEKVLHGVKYKQFDRTLNPDQMKELQKIEKKQLEEAHKLERKKEEQRLQQYLKKGVFGYDFNKLPEPHRSEWNQFKQNQETQKTLLASAQTDQESKMAERRAADPDYLEREVARKEAEKKASRRALGNFIGDQIPIYGDIKRAERQATEGAGALEDLGKILK